jgi:3-methyl-2-oxobutanoate hydroxymethyltransferase
MKKLNTRQIRQHKRQQGAAPLSMLTCYDFQTAQLLNESELDLILVGDSLGNVVLGYDTTIEVTLDEMIVFSSAVKRGAFNKFIVADLPFGTYSTLNEGLKSAKRLYQQSRVEALKLEGAYPYQLELISRLTQIGIPVMGHIGLTPQSVNEQGGYFIHGKSQQSSSTLLKSALELQKAGVFALVLECLTPELASEITTKLSVPTIGIGSGKGTDGQVLVINDLFKMGKQMPPKFCTPMADFYTLKGNLVEQYLASLKKERNEQHLYH